MTKLVKKFKERQIPNFIQTKNIFNSVKNYLKHKIDKIFILVQESNYLLKKKIKKKNVNTGKR